MDVMDGSSASDPNIMARLAVQKSRGTQYMSRLLLKMLKSLKRLNLPPHPQGESSESLEKERVEVLCEVMKRDHCQAVAEKMAKTFSLQRQENKKKYYSL